MPSHTHPRRPLRLKGYDYSQAGAYFVTICTHQRISRFGEIIDTEMRLNPDGLVVNAAWHELPRHYPNTSLDAFVVMPNHVHLLTEGLQQTSNLLQFIKAFKTKTSIPFERKTGKPLWQKKFYDHILRRNDSPDDVAWYIWMNPVRAGLCRRPEEYPFLGSFTGMWPKTPAPYAPWLPPWNKDAIQPL